MSVSRDMPDLSLFLGFITLVSVSLQYNYHASFFVFFFHGGLPRLSLFHRDIIITFMFHGDMQRLSLFHSNISCLSFFPEDIRVTPVSVSRQYISRLSVS